MTNEEILAAVKDSFQEIEPGSDLHNCIRSLVSQAYEEAVQQIQEVEESKKRLRDKYDEGTTDYLVLNNQVQACAQARDKVRALKDSLSFFVASSSKQP